MPDVSKLTVIAIICLVGLLPMKIGIALAQLDIETIEGGADKAATTKRPTPSPRGRSMVVLNRTKSGETSSLPFERFTCVVCDDIKDANCQPWDKKSHVKKCFDDPRINKSQPVGCRKMVQYVGQRTYVSRHCTNLVGDHLQGCIDRVGTKKIKVMYCHCKGEQNCNSGSKLSGTGTHCLACFISAFAILFAAHLWF